MASMVPLRTPCMWKECRTYGDFSKQGAGAIRIYLYLLTMHLGLDAE